MFRLWLGISFTLLGSSTYCEVVIFSFRIRDGKEIRIRDLRSQSSDAEFDPGSGMEKFGSGTNIPDPQHWLHTFPYYFGILWIRNARIPPCSGYRRSELSLKGKGRILFLIQFRKLSLTRLACLQHTGPRHKFCRKATLSFSQWFLRSLNCASLFCMIKILFISRLGLSKYLSVIVGLAGS